MLAQSFTWVAARLVFSAFAILALSASAEAAFITFVGANGNDANACTSTTAPCKTLQRAVNAVAANGTVKVLTPLQSAVSINKSITILGDGAPIVGRIIINSPTAVVTLRGLALNGVRSLDHGIRIISAAAVFIEDCTVERYASDGITMTAAAKLFISNTIVRANGSDGLHVEATNAQAEIKNSRFEGNAHSGAYLKLYNVNITGSAASGNASSGIALRSPWARIQETTADDNSGDGYLVYEGSPTLISANSARNGSSDLFVANGASVSISHCTFAFIRNQGQLFSFKNNVLSSSWTGNAPMTATAF